MLEQEGGPLCSRGCCWDLASLRTRPEPSPGWSTPFAGRAMRSRLVQLHTWGNQGTLEQR